MLPLKPWVTAISEADLQTVADAAARTLLHQPDIWQTTTDHDTIAYYARINTMLLAAEAGGDAQTVRDALSRLWSMRYTSATGQPGLGLDFAFDAFGDGTTNPATTIYTYTVGMAMLTLLDAHAVLGDAAWLDQVKQFAAMELSDCFGYDTSATDGRMAIFYDDQPQDQAGSTFVVANVNALLISALSRITTLDGTAYSQLEPIKRYLAEMAQQDYLDARWDYQSYAGGKANDQVHAAYLVEGCAWAGLPMVHRAQYSGWVDYWNSDGSVNTGNSQALGSNLWGPGEMLSSFSLLPQWQAMAARAALHIASTVDANGLCSYADPNDSRSNVRYGLGLARFVARCTTDAPIFPDQRVSIPF